MRESELSSSVSVGRRTLHKLPSEIPSPGIQGLPVFAGYLSCARALFWAQNNPFHRHTPYEICTTIPPFYKWRNWGKDRVSHLGTATQLGTVRPCVGFMQLESESAVLGRPRSVVPTPACALEWSGELAKGARDQREILPGPTWDQSNPPSSPFSKVRGHSLPVFLATYPSFPWFHDICRVFNGLLQVRAYSCMVWLCMAGPVEVGRCFLPEGVSPAPSAACHTHTAPECSVVSGWVSTRLSFRVRGDPMMYGASVVNWADLILLILAYLSLSFLTYKIVKVIILRWLWRLNEICENMEYTLSCSR